MKGNLKSSVVAPYAPVVLKLLVNPLFSDDTTHWNLLLTYQQQVQEHLAHIGLALEVQEADGYAYLYQPEVEDDEGRVLALPRITRRDHLTYHATLLCVLLREWLDQQETHHLDTSGYFITGEQIRDLMLPFLHERTDMRKVQRRIDTVINQIIDLGFLKQLSEQRDVTYFEVRRILKARIDIEKLVEIKEKIQCYGTVEDRGQENDVRS